MNLEEAIRAATEDVQRAKAAVAPVDPQVMAAAMEAAKKAAILETWKAAIKCAGGKTKV